MRFSYFAIYLNFLPSTTNPQETKMSPNTSEYALSAGVGRVRIGKICRILTFPPAAR